MRRGFIVRSVERLEEHPVWKLILRTGSVTDSRELRVIQRNVSMALREVGCICPPREVTAAVNGNRLIVAFVWDRGAD